MNSFKETDEKENVRNPQPSCELLDTLEILRKLPIFGNIPLEIVRLYALVAKRVFFQEERFLFRKGDRAQDAYLILSGKAQMFLDIGEKVFKIQVLGPMDFFSEMALLADFERVLSVQALTPVEALLLERSGFQKIMEQYPKRGLQVLEKIIQIRMGRLQKKVSRLVHSVKDGEPMIRFEDWIGM